jgi:hypothetical protein
VADHFVSQHPPHAATGRPAMNDPMLEVSAIVQPGPAGSRIIHRVYHVARQMRWAVPLANRFFIGFRRRTEECFTAFIEQIAREAGAHG